MTATKSKLTVGLLSLFFMSPVLAKTCKVTDPTDTPLNVRHAPAGKITGKLPNGKVVYITEYAYDKKGNPWVMIFDAKTDTYLGWVFREFVSCF